MFLKIVSSRIKSWLKGKIKAVVDQHDLPLASVKYIPCKQDATSYKLSKPDKGEAALCESGLAIPPPAFMEGLSNSAEEYLSIGKEHTATMLRAIEDSGYSFSQG
ncbi:MAG: hypothetical protein SGI83_02630 [Bacteroidota bacterium]|nr:hypothetical protein [Bacteroidota bacterium]